MTSLQQSMQYSNTPAQLWDFKISISFWVE